MMNYELAIDEDGEPFQVSPEVVGWRVRRALDGRGRPLLVHGRGADKGKPLILRVNATHADLLAAAGPGRYRLEGVDEHRRKVEGLPIACTGPLSDDDDATDDDDVTAPAELVGRDPVRRVTSYGDVICQLVATNTRVMEKALDQIGSVMSGVANLLDVTRRAGFMTQLPPPPLAPVGEVIYDAEAEQTGAEGTEDMEAPASSSMIPEMIQLVIKEATSKAVTLIFEKISTNALPLEAILDWRKAAPSTPPVPAPAAPSAPAASAPSWPTTAAESAPMTTFTQTAAAGAAAAGVASSQPPHHGATPAELAAPPAANLPENHEAAAALINAHVVQVWQRLSPPEQARAAQLIARLTQEERAAWMAELAQLTLPEAIARARAVIHGKPPTTSTQIPTATTKEEPS